MKNLVKFLMIGTAILALTACEPGKFKSGDCGGSTPTFDWSKRGDGQGAAFGGGQGTGFGGGRGAGCDQAWADFDGLFRFACGPETFTPRRDAGADLIWVLDCKPVAGGPEYVYTPKEAPTFQGQRINCGQPGNISCGQSDGSGKLPQMPRLRSFHRLVAYDAVTFKRVSTWFIIDGGSKCDASGDGAVPPTDDGTVTPPPDEGTDTPCDGGADTPCDGGDVTPPSADDGTVLPPVDEDTDTPGDDGTVVPGDDGTVVPGDEGSDETPSADEGGSQATGNRARIEELVYKYIQDPTQAANAMAWLEETGAPEAGINLDEFDIDAWGAQNGFDDLDNLSDTRVQEFIIKLMDEFSAA